MRQTALDLAVFLALAVFSNIAGDLAFGRSSASNSTDIAIKSVLISLAILASRPSGKAVVNVRSVAGLILSFVGPGMMSFQWPEVPRIVSVVFTANVGFYFLVFSFGLTSLGRSFGILPAAKGLVTAGLYKTVRHPIYASYLHSALGWYLVVPSLQNFIGVSALMIGLSLRSWEEEAVLISDPRYVEYLRKVRRRFFTLPITAPVLLLAFTLVVFRPGWYTLSKTRELTVHFGFPVSGINPLICDDWSCLFVINHIFPRLKFSPDLPSEFGVNGPIQIDCFDDKMSNRDTTCRELKMRIPVVERQLCNGEVLGYAQIRDELMKILRAKNWIWPGVQECSSEASSEICLKGPSLPDLIRRFENVYIRFGWSKPSETGRQGGGPYCLESGPHEKFPLNHGLLVAKIPNSQFRRLNFTGSSDSPGEFDLSIYGNEGAVTQDHEKLNVHTPLGYFVVTNPRYLTTDLPWNTPGAASIIRKHLSRFGLIYELGRPSDFLPTGAAIGEHSKLSKTSNLKPKILLIPSYLPECEDLAKALTEYFSEGSARAVCGNTSALAEQIVKFGKIDWSAFLTPLSPGAAFKDAIQSQYFESSSSDSYTGRYQGAGRYFYLVGAGQTFVVAKKGLFCGVKPNILGVGDILVTSLHRCD